MQDPARLQFLQKELRDALSALAPEDGDFTVAEDVEVFRRSSPTSLHHGESKVSYYAVAQGAQQVEFGKQQYLYGSDHFLVTSIGLPMVSRVVEATAESPYLGMSLNLNQGLVRSVIMATLPENLQRDSGCCAYNVQNINTSLLDATVRLMQSVSRSAESAYMVPLIKQEIVFRLLLTSHAERLRQIAGMCSISNQVKRAVELLSDQYSDPLRVSDIARCAGMSVSSLHEHFKRVTGLTPLQYQKELRLREARHLLTTAGMDAAEAGFAVGYNDASHFNRDYKKHFGQSPIRDVAAQREAESLANARD